MTATALPISLQGARRLTLAKQHLAGPLPSRFTSTELLSVVRDLGYVQWDPVSVVAPSHLLSLHCRLGGFRAEDLDRALWTDKTLFEHWTPLASIVLTEDYRLFASLMRRYPESMSRSWGAQGERAQEFLRTHSALRKKVLAELSAGPRTASQFGDHRTTKSPEGAWGFGSDVATMLFHLTMTGEVMVVGHEGNQNLWGRTESFLSEGTDRRPLSAEEFEREAAQRALRALGTATPREITLYFVRGRYAQLGRTLRRLAEESTIQRVRVDGTPRTEERYIHRDDLALLETVSSGDWTPRMSLVPPFDNLLFSQARTNRLFGFDYVREQFLPKEKRRFGTYVLPIVFGETLIGRVDPKVDRERDRLLVHAVHAEAGAPMDPEVGAEIATTLERLARFLGVSEVSYSSRVPRAWKSALH